MYVLKEETKEILKNYKYKAVAQEIGINSYKLSDMVNKNDSCMKQTAYCLTKFLDSDKEIEDFFLRKEI